MAIFTLSMDIEVTDPGELWHAAYDHLKEARVDDPCDVIGTSDKPNVGACLQMLLDRSEHLAGAEIQNSTVEGGEDEEEEG